ncbi:hypothetical protein Kuura_057 [Caulobacter phage Kuura]|nr:hypothetical protein Kuura_057 [Caulobacter phage Kuura]
MILFPLMADLPRVALDGKHHSPRIHKPRRNRGTGAGVDRAKYRETVKHVLNERTYAAIPTIAQINRKVAASR